ncbi:MAG TPA: hypothetical protein VLK23_00585 [Thermodesulfobacteriota bacterium]|nr:hypothetical protein [Thermodesulfobacteriota bacterium]
MKTIFILTILNIVLLTFSLSIAEDDYVRFAKSLMAKDYEQSLPSIPIQEWLRSILPNGIVALWNPTITDCGEQTGDAEIDKNRDIPMCAEIELKENGTSVGYLLLMIGTQRKGNVKEYAALFSGFVTRHEKTINLRKLSDLSKMR